MPVVIQPGAQNTSKAMVLWDSVLTRAVTATDFGTDPNHPSINCRNDEATWSSWRTNVADGYFTADLGSNTTVSAIGISSHNLASSGAGVIVSHSDDGIAWVDMDTVNPTNDEDLIVLFGNVTARHWRVTITGAAASIGVVFLGRPLVFPHAPVDSYAPLHHSRRYEKLYNDSLKGHFLSNRVMSAGAETDVDMGFLDRNWLENNIRGFERHYNQGRTFFYAGCPSRYPDDLGYCRSAGSDESLAIEFIEGDRLSSLSFGVRSFVGA